MGTIKNVLCPLSEGRQIGGARQGVSSAVVGRLPVRARMECGIISTKAQLVAAVDSSSYGVPKSETVSPAIRHDTPPVTPPVIPPVTPPVNEKQKRLLQALKGTTLGTSELMKTLHIRDRNYFREGYIRPTLRAGLIEQTMPEVKHSRLQKYRLTDKGRVFIAECK